MRRAAVQVIDRVDQAFNTMTHYVKRPARGLCDEGEPHVDSRANIVQSS